MREPILNLPPGTKIITWANAWWLWCLIVKWALLLSVGLLVFALTLCFGMVKARGQSEALRFREQQMRDHRWRRGASRYL